MILRLDAAAGVANAKVLLHPTSAKEVALVSNNVGIAVSDFHGKLGIKDSRASIEARRA